MKISVVTITLNRREFLKKAIESVLAQNYPNFEHIVIDGGSIDGSVELLKNYSHLTWVSEPDNGQADAMNKGIKKITGDIFAWLNSDDTYPEETFYKVNNHFLSDPKVGIIYGLCHLVNKAGKRIGKTNFHKFDLSRIIMGFNNINTPAVFVNSKILKEIGSFDTSLKATYDIDLWIRIAKRYPVLAVPDFFSNLCFHEGSGLISTQLHKNEIPILRKKYWTSKKVQDLIMRYPYFKFRSWLFEKLKFASLVKNMHL